MNLKLSQLRLAGFLILVGIHAGRAEGPFKSENLATSASITAESEYSGGYKAQFVADGHIPAAQRKRDVGRAWCVKGNTHRKGAWLNFEWEEPVVVREIIYYGRTAWFFNECWKDYEVYLDGADTAAVKGRLKAGHGPQRISLPKAATVLALRLKFTSSYGGYNPGASEVMVFSASPPEKALGKFSAPKAHAGPVVYAERDAKFEESPKSQQLRADLLAGRLGFKSLVLIQRRELNPSHVYSYHNEGFRTGGGLYHFTPDEKDGELKELVASPDGQLLDCDVSYDGSQILFSWRKNRKDTYQLYRINVDGSGLEQITEDACHNYNACWLPDGGIAFLSDRKPAYAYCHTSTVGVLYRMDRGGKNIRRLSANYLNDFTPCVMNDGSLIYGRWEYVDRPAIPIQSLWTINPDGSELSVFYGNRVLSPATFIEPRPIPGTTKVLCTMTAHNGPCRGAIGIIDPSHGVNAQASIRNLTPEVNIGQVGRGSGNHIRGPFESPYPLDAQHFLASRRGTILLRDYDGTKQCVLIRPAGGMGFYNVQPIRKRQRPPQQPSRLPESKEDRATVFVQDVYNGLEPYVKRGEVKQLCVVQEIEKSKFASNRYRAFGFQFPVVSCGATYAPKKVWGYADVEDDGSANFKVPAGIPIYFMALDAEGRAVQRMRSFTHFMPGEVRGCVGCHESRSKTARMAGRPLATMRSPQDLEPPEWGLTGFSYSRIVQPVLDRYCVECHNATNAPKGIDLAGDRTDFFNVSYEKLAREGRPGANPYTKWIPTFNGHEANILQVTPKAWGSPASKLADIILTGHPDEDGKARFKMDDLGRRRIMAWIDLNVPYYGTSHSNHYNRKGCRQMTPPALEATLRKVAGKRCVSCHKPGGKGSARIPRQAWLRITNPHLNNFLLAPLAKAGGGTEACGQPVFKSKADPDYLAILKTFEPLHKLLKETPRKDMPGG